MSKKLHSFRFDPNLIEWADNYAKRRGITRTALVEALLGALRDERLWVEPTPNPFPAMPETLPVKHRTEGVPAGTYPHRFKEKEDTNAR